MSWLLLSYGPRVMWADNVGPPCVSSAAAPARQLGPGVVKVAGVDTAL